MLELKKNFFLYCNLLYYILYYDLMNCCLNVDPAANTINVGVPDTTIYL